MCARSRAVSPEHAAEGFFSVVRTASLVSFFPRRGPQARWRIHALKDAQGTGRSVMVIGSSGAGTLVNPFSQDARARMEALAHPASTLPAFREEVRLSVVKRRPEFRSRNLRPLVLAKRFNGGTRRGRICRLAGTTSSRAFCSIASLVRCREMAGFVV